MASNIKRICAYDECGKEFTITAGNQKTCSLECSRAKRKKYNKEYHGGPDGYYKTKYTNDPEFREKRLSGERRRRKDRRMENLL